MKKKSDSDLKNFGVLINKDLSDQEIINSTGIEGLNESAWSIFIGENGIFYSSFMSNANKKGIFVADLNINLDIMLEYDNEMSFLCGLNDDEKLEKIAENSKLSDLFMKKIVTFVRDGINSYNFSNQGPRKIEQISYFLSKRRDCSEKPH